jgi:hypothetical protein
MSLAHLHIKISVRARTTRAITLGALLLATLNSSLAQDTNVVTSKPNQLYPMRRKSHVSMELRLP